MKKYGESGESHGVDQEDNSEWFRSYDPKADRKAYGDLRKIVGQRATVGDFDGGRQEVSSAFEGGDFDGNNSPDFRRTSRNDGVTK